MTGLVRKKWYPLLGIFLCGLVTNIFDPFPLDAQGRHVDVIDWSRDGNRIAIGYDDFETIEILDAATLQVIRSFQVSFLSDIAWCPTPNRKLLAIAQYYAGVRVVDTDSGATLLEIKDIYDYRITSIAWSPDGTKLAAGHVIGSLLGEDAQAITKIWDALTGQLITQLDGYRHKYAVSSISWSPDGSRLLTAGGDEVHVWDATSGSHLAFIEAPMVQDAEWRPDGEQIIIVGDHSRFPLVDASTYQLVTYIDLVEIANQAEWRPDGTQVAIHAYDRVYVLDSQTLAVLYSSERISYPARGIAWSPDGMRLAFGGSETGDFQIVNAPLPPVFTPTPTETSTPTVTPTPTETPTVP